MNIKRVWLECEDENGQSFMAPATPEDLKALQYQAESSADEMIWKDLAVCVGADKDCKAVLKRV